MRCNLNAKQAGPRGWGRTEERVPWPDPPSERCDYLAVANDSLTPPRVACQIETHCEQLKIALAAGIVARGPGRVIDRHATTQKQQLPAAHGGSYLVCRMRATHTDSDREREREKETEAQIQRQTAGNDLVTKLE